MGVSDLNTVPSTQPSLGDVSISAVPKTPSTSKTQLVSIQQLKGLPDSDGSSVTPHQTTIISLTTKPRMEGDVGFDAFDEEGSENTDKILGMLSDLETDNIPITPISIKTLSSTERSSLHSAVVAKAGVSGLLGVPLFFHKKHIEEAKTAKDCHLHATELGSHKGDVSDLVFAGTKGADGVVSLTPAMRQITEERRKLGYSTHMILAGQKHDMNDETKFNTMSAVDATRWHQAIHSSFAEFQARAAQEAEKLKHVMPELHVMKPGVKPVKKPYNKHLEGNVQDLIIAVKTAQQAVLTKAAAAAKDSFTEKMERIFEEIFNKKAEIQEEAVEKQGINAIVLQDGINHVELSATVGKLSTLHTKMRSAEKP